MDSGRARVVFLPAGLDACALYRMFLTHLHLPGSEFVFEYGPLPITRFRGCNIAVVQRLCSVENYKAMEAMKQMGMKIIYDLDDNFWDIPEYNPGHEAFKKMLPGFHFCASRADLITVSTNNLRVRVLRELGTDSPPVRVIQNAIDLNWFAPIPKTHRREKPGVVVGWAGTNTHKGDVQQLFLQLPRLLEELPEMYLELAGLPPPEEIKDHPRVRQRDFVPVAEFPARWASWQWDLALAPLEENAFNLSKCLSTQTSVYGLVDGMPRRQRLIHFLKQPGEKYLPGPDGKWRRVLAWEKMKERLGIYVKVRGGDIFHVTPDHRFQMKDDSLKRVWQLKKGDLLKLVSGKSFPDHASPSADIADYQMGWFLGQYLADGVLGTHDPDSFARGGLSAVYISVDVRKKDLIEKLFEVGRRWGALVTLRHYPDMSKNGATVEFLACPALCGFLRQYAVGVDSYTKAFRSLVWKESREFLKGIVDGWLDGDGHKVRNRKSFWTFGITRNWNLVKDLQLACLLAGYRFRFARRFGKDQTGKLFKLITGTVLKESIGYQSEKSNGEVLEVREGWVSTVAVEVDGDKLFVLPSGVVSHNSNIKILEATAVGIPCLASAVGPYMDFCRGGSRLKRYLLCKKPQEWVPKITALVRNAELRKELADEARQVVCQTYAIERRISDWQAVFEEVMN